MKPLIEELESRNLLDASPIGGAISAQISQQLTLADGSKVALFDPDGPGPDYTVIIGKVTGNGTTVELLAILLPDGNSVNGFSLSKGLEPNHLDFIYVTQPGPYQNVTVHWMRASDVPGSIPPPATQTVQPEPIQAMPKEVLPAPTEEPAHQMFDAALALAQDLRFHEPGDN